MNKLKFLGPFGVCPQNAIRWRELYFEALVAGARIEVVIQGLKKPRKL